MPDSVTHHYFGWCVWSELETEIRQGIDAGVFERALQGPDPWSTIGFFGGDGKQFARRSGVMHKERTGLFLETLARESAAEPELPTFSVLAGFICHYCLDRLAHPYITCKGGEYDGTPATNQFRGGHVRLERAIDSYIIRTHYGAVPWHFSIPRRILGLKRYPESLRRPLNRVFRRVYGWEDSFDLLNRAMKDEARFYALMQDPTGLVHYLLRMVSGGKTNYCMYSYYRRDADGEKLDYLNEGHRPWNHPFDPEIHSEESFFDLFERAKADAVKMIRGASDVVSGGKNVDLSALFGNSSYATGFDCDDPRNGREPICQPLSYGGSYWNHE